MKTLSIIGGIAPESTIEYYSFIIESYRKADSSSILFMGIVGTLFKSHLEAITMR